MAVQVTVLKVYIAGLKSAQWNLPVLVLSAPALIYIAASDSSTDASVASLIVS